MLNLLATFARNFNVSVADAYVLPAVFERSAEKVGMTPLALVTETSRNQKLGEYLANVARVVAAEDRKAA